MIGYQMITTVLGTGHLRPAPGTWGSLVALPLAWAVHELAGFWIFLILTILLFLLGWWATSEVTRGQEDHDPSEIVIDELVGMCVAMIPICFASAMLDMPSLMLWPGWVSAFVLFRIFDIWKPGPVGWADRRDDALGVMLDDVVAGLFAAICTIALAAIAHGLVMA